MEMTGEMLYRIWLDCSGCGRPRCLPTLHERFNPVEPSWEQLTPEGRESFECMAKKLEAMAD